MAIKFIKDLAESRDATYVDTSYALISVSEEARKHEIDPRTARRGILIDYNRMKEWEKHIIAYEKAKEKAKRLCDDIFGKDRTRQEAI